jgi:tetratricopeptide (TPR) repeat protein
MLSVSRKLVKVAPDFPAGHAQHAIAAAQVIRHTNPSAAEVALLRQESKAAAASALALNPRFGKAYFAQALNEPRRDRLAIERYLKQSLALDPDYPGARGVYAELLFDVGRIDEAIQLSAATNAVADPREGPGDTQWPALLLASKGDIAGAHQMIDREEAARRLSMSVLRFTIAFWWEDPRVALEALARLPPGEESPANADCYRRYVRELATRKAAGVRGLPAGCEGVGPPWRIRMLARQGDIDGAFAAMAQDDGTWNPRVLYYPEMKPVRRDPRFWPLAARLGLADYWLKGGHWPDFCAEPDLPYDCRKAAAAAL